MHVPPEPRKMMRFTEVADYLGIDRRTVGRWVRDGILPSVEDPDTGTVWVPRASLDRWLSEQRGTGQSVNGSQASGAV